MTKEEREKIIKEVKAAMPDIKEDEIFVKDKYFGEGLSLKVRWNLDKAQFKQVEPKKGRQP